MNEMFAAYGHPAPSLRLFFTEVLTKEHAAIP
jgi:hypothetical protein